MRPACSAPTSSPQRDRLKTASARDTDAGRRARDSSVDTWNCGVATTAVNAGGGAKRRKRTCSVCIAPTTTPPNRAGAMLSGWFSSAAAQSSSRCGSNSAPVM